MRTATNYFYSALAQLVEQLTVNQRVVGSSPTGGATFLFIHQRVSGMEYGVDSVLSDLGKHKIQLTAACLPYPHAPPQEAIPPTRIHKLERLQFE